MCDRKDKIGAKNVPPSISELTLVKWPLGKKMKFRKQQTGSIKNRYDQIRIKI